MQEILLSIEEYKRYYDLATKISLEFAKIKECKLAERNQSRAYNSAVICITNLLITCQVWMVARMFTIFSIFKKIIFMI